MAVNRKSHPEAATPTSVEFLSGVTSAQRQSAETRPSAWSLLAGCGVIALLYLGFLLIPIQAEATTAQLRTVDVHFEDPFTVDWGSALGLHYSRLNPGRIKGIVTMEAQLAPILPAGGYDEMGEDLGNFFQMVRDPENSEKLLIEDNIFIEQLMPAFIDRPLDQEAHDAYRQPFTDASSRKPIYQWPQEIPIGGEPIATHAAMSGYNEWLTQTNTPWLFIYASPGALNPPEVAAYWAERARNIETAYIGNGLHYLQEDQPYAIGRAIADWHRRHTATN